MIPLGTDIPLRRMPVVTLALIGINTVLYCAGFQSTDFVINAYAHGDWSHLFGNMLFLWVFGSNTEDKIGRALFFIYYHAGIYGAEAMNALVSGRPGLGASGAIAGVMGLFLYRCYYSNISAISIFTALLGKLTIHARWLLPFWFLRDLYYGVYGSGTNVGHWAHVGGYLTGMMLGALHRYPAVARKEHLLERVREALSGEANETEAEACLMKARAAAPEDPEVRLRLARFHAGRPEGARPARKYYLLAGEALYKRPETRTEAGRVLYEYLLEFRHPASARVHLEYAIALDRVRDFAPALGILEVIIDKGRMEGAIGERILFEYARLSMAAGQREPAESALHRLRQDFKGSRMIVKVEGLLASSFSTDKRADACLPEQKAGTFPAGGPEGGGRNRRLPGSPGGRVWPPEPGLT